MSSLTNLWMAATSETPSYGSSSRVRDCARSRISGCSASFSASLRMIPTVASAWPYDGIDPTCHENANGVPVTHLLRGDVVLLRPEVLRFVRLVVVFLVVFFEVEILVLFERGPHRFLQGELVRLNRSPGRGDGGFRSRECGSPRRDCDSGRHDFVFLVGHLYLEGDLVDEVFVE